MLANIAHPETQKSLGRFTLKGQDQVLVTQTKTTDTISDAKDNGHERTADPMRILALHFVHDANCTLLEDGEPVVVIEKERLTRQNMIMDPWAWMPYWKNMDGTPIRLISSPSAPT